MNNIITLLSTKFFGKKIGEDSAGNKYFYKSTKHNRQKRWVIYAKEPEGSSIPPEWQAWLTQTTEVAPINIKTYSWQKSHKSNATGTKDAYSPKLTINRKKTKKIQNQSSSWTPYPKKGK